MSDQFVGEIQAFTFPFAVTGFNNAWLPCGGQLLSIQQYTALFALIGTYYGGNGTTNFALPNLNGSVAISQGQGPGLQTYVIGETVGSVVARLLGSGRGLRLRALALQPFEKLEHVLPFRLRLALVVRTPCSSATRPRKEALLVQERPGRQWRSIPNSTASWRRPAT